MTAIFDPVTRQWLAHSLLALAPVLRELAAALGTPASFNPPPTPEELTRAADVIERTATSLGQDARLIKFSP